MDVLAYELKNMALRVGGGSAATRDQRHRGLQLIAAQLRDMGHKLPSARSIKERHIHKLIARWKEEQLSTGTLKNRMSWVRFWVAGVRKNSILPGDNSDLGIERRAAFNGNKARSTSWAVLQKLPERMQLAVALQERFGMRLEESILFRPGEAVQGGALHMRARWCKGGRARVIPIETDKQRSLLAKLREVAGEGCLIPSGMAEITFRKQLERKTWGVGIRNLHGHRHYYAQQRFRVLTGRDCPAAGGPVYASLSAKERALDLAARKTISAELGHGRLGVTDTYLGSRYGRRGA